MNRNINRNIKRNISFAQLCLCALQSLFQINDNKRNINRNIKRNKNRNINRNMNRYMNRNIYRNILFAQLGLLALQWLQM